jgi:hypothetical protein
MDEVRGCICDSPVRRAHALEGPSVLANFDKYCAVAQRDGIGFERSRARGPKHGTCANVELAVVPRALYDVSLEGALFAERGMHVRARVIRDEELAIDVIDGQRTETWDPNLCVGLWLYV